MKGPLSLLAVGLSACSQAAVWRRVAVEHTSGGAKQTDHCVLDLRVPAGGQAQPAYSVRYRWPADLRP